LCVSPRSPPLPGPEVSSAGLPESPRTCTSSSSPARGGRRAWGRGSEVPCALAVREVARHRAREEPRRRRRRPAQVDGVHGAGAADT
jgi:hypothetical protein